MLLSSLFRSVGINEGAARCFSTPGAVLLDVRSRDEYDAGHIRGSRNLPLQEIDSAAALLPDKGMPVFVCCLSGARSARAVQALKGMGYRNVTNIGGLTAWRGELEK